MDYLVSEGYPSAAKKFALEADIQPAEDVSSIRERVEIRNAIYRGDIQNAMTRINGLGYQVSRLFGSWTVLYLGADAPVLAMIKLSFMHHSYALYMGVDDNNLTFTRRYEQVRFDVIHQPLPRKY